MVDVVAALNGDLRDVAILQQQHTSSQQPEIDGNTNINNENQEQGGDDRVNNATRQARKNPDTGRQIRTRTGTGKVAGYNELGTEDCPRLASVPTITYLQEQLALRDTKNCCYGTEYQSVETRCEGLTTKILATYVDH